jgi:hypothetical protein
MRFSKSVGVPRLRTCAVAVAIGLLAAIGGCSVLLDHGTTQCRTDSDCLDLGVLPSCQSGVCVNTGIPCFVGTPDASIDFLNQCTTATHFPFDDCQRLGVCGDDAPPDAVNPPPPDGGSQSAAAPGDPSTYPNCADLSPGVGGPVYVTGSSNFPTFLAQVAPLVIGGAPPSSPGPAIVWLTTSSCQGADAIFSPDAAANIIRDPADGAVATAYAQYSLIDGGTMPCLLGEGGAHVDVGESDVYSTTCNMSYSTTSATDTLGPIQAMEFVVPELSGQDSISQEAAREVFGIGGNDGGAFPWVNPQRYYVRNKNTGTQQMIGAAIHVSPSEFWGIDRGTATNVHDQMQLLSAPDEAAQAIGILSNDVYDHDRSNLRVLAYEAAGQNGAYLPDSTPDTYDKQNVRDGHYPIWGPVHFFTKNSPPSQVLAFVNYFNGAQNTPAILDAFIDANLIPNCAMSVIRSENAELSELASYMPEHSCACYFLANAQPPAAPDGGMGSQLPTPLPPECTTCKFASDCPASRPACNFGYCELQ